MGSFETEGLGYDARGIPTFLGLRLCSRVGVSRSWLFG